MEIKKMSVSTLFEKYLWLGKTRSYVSMQSLPRKVKEKTVRKYAQLFPLQLQFIKAADGRELKKSENTNICLEECLMKVKKQLKVWVFSLLLFCFYL